MKKEKTKKIIAVVGPTASGKTALAVKLAKMLDTEIISADSRQVFKEFDIAVAKPSKDEMQGVTHHLIDVVNPDEDFTVADFSDKAQKVTEMLFSKEKIPIVAGGTGLYFRILLENYEMPRVAPDKKLREEFHKIEREQGVEALYSLLKEADPVLAEKMHPNNTVKIVRALEVCKILKKPMSEVQKVGKDNKYDVFWLGLGHLNGEDRQYLYDRTDKRVDVMLEKGLEKEARTMFEKYGKIPSLMNTIGYQEFEQYFEGLMSYEEAVEKIKQNTRRYAKRQLTWFRRNSAVEWLETKDKTGDEIFEELKNNKRLCKYLEM